MKDRTKSGLILIAIALAISVILGAIFALISSKERPFAENIWSLIEIMFWYFGAGCVLSGILVCVTKIDENHCFGLGLALYYGTIILAGILENIIHGPIQNILAVSFIIVALLCYIYWLKNLKPQDDD